MAGEIQLNSTTMATESSGSITAQLDTIRPNTTNGSLVLQGDSSDAGVTGLTIDSSGNATFAQTITGGTIGSGVVIPSFVGMIASFAMSSAPTGWLVCNGAEYAIATYGDLYTAIGTTWGALTDGSGGAGSTHFRVPDLRGAFLRGTGSHGTSNMADGNDFAGPNVGSFENDQFQGHKHAIKGISNGSAGSADWLMRSNAVGISYDGWMDDTPTSDPNNGTPRTGDETRPFNAGINYCIKY